MGEVDGSSCRFYRIYAALIYLKAYPNRIRGVIVDSPFSSLRNLIKELASAKTGLPEFIFQAVLPFVDK